MPKEFRFPAATPTATGIKTDLKALYQYEDDGWTHYNLVFADGTNWPLADDLEFIGAIAGLLRHNKKLLRQHRTRIAANGSGVYLRVARNPKGVILIKNPKVFSSKDNWVVDQVFTNKDEARQFAKDHDLVIVGFPVGVETA